MNDKKDEKDKKDFIGTGSMTVLVLNAVLQAVVSFITFQFLTTWWENRKQRQKHEKTDETN